MLSIAQRAPTESMCQQNLRVNTTIRDSGTYPNMRANINHVKLPASSTPIDGKVDVAAANVCCPPPTHRCGNDCRAYSMQASMLVCSLHINSNIRKQDPKHTHVIPLPPQSNMNATWLCMCEHAMQNRQHARASYSKRVCV